MNKCSNVDGWFNLFSGDPTGGDLGGVQVHRQKQAMKQVQQAAAYAQAAAAAYPGLPPVCIPVVDSENKWRMIFLDTFGVNKRNGQKVQAAYAGVVQMLGDIDRNIRILRGGGGEQQPQAGYMGGQQAYPNIGACPLYGGAQPASQPVWG